MVPTMTDRWQKWKNLDWEQQKLFWRSLFLLKAAGFLLRFFLYQDVYKRIENLVPLAKPAAVEPDLEKAAAIAAIVELAARRRLAQATCLRRSLVLWYLLRRQGIDSEIRLGIRKQDDRALGHAWVEIDGHIINDDSETIQHYTRIDLSQRPLK
jgi:hypothetical protein